MVPLVAWTVVLPVFVQVTAPAVGGITANSDVRAVTSTARRTILLMVLLLDLVWDATERASPYRNASCARTILTR